MNALASGYIIYIGFSTEFAFHNDVGDLFIYVFFVSDIVGDKLSGNNIINKISALFNKLRT